VDQDVTRRSLPASRRVAWGRPPRATAAPPRCREPPLPPR
jgi:hypothetical protein